MTPTTAAATTGPEAVHVAAARGYLTAALTAIPRQHEAVLELSAAWSELAEPARLPEVTDPQPGRDGDTPAVLLAAARTALLSGVLAATVPARIIAVALAIRHVDAAIVLLTWPTDDDPPGSA